MAAEVEAREAAERRADSVERQCDSLLADKGGDDSFEAALAADLNAMREAYEAKLKAASEAARLAALEHRKEMRAAHEERDRERRAAEARMRAARPPSAVRRSGAADGSLTAR